VRWAAATGVQILELLSKRKRLTLGELQVTRSAAKLGAKVGGAYEKARRGGICLGVN
jgi:hypothetical protein